MSKIFRKETVLMPAKGKLRDVSGKLIIRPKVARVVYRNSVTGRFCSKAEWEGERKGVIPKQTFNYYEEIEYDYINVDDSIDHCWGLRAEQKEEMFSIAEEIEGWVWNEEVKPTSKREYEEEMEWHSFHQSVASIVEDLGEEPRPRIVNNHAFVNARVKLLMRKGMSREEALKEVCS